MTPQLDRTVLLRADTSDSDTWHECFDHEYHVPPIAFVPATVLDLGANIGLTAAHYRRLWPEAEIVAVELSSENAAIAARNAPGVIHRNIGVSGTGGARYYDGQEWNRLRLTTKGSLVETVTLRELILERWDEVDFCKMDVEGAEWEIIASSDWVPHVRSLLIELHGEEEPDVLERYGVKKLRGFG